MLLLTACACGEHNDVTLNCKIVMRTSTVKATADLDYFGNMQK